MTKIVKKGTYRYSMIALLRMPLVPVTDIDRKAPVAETRTPRVDTSSVRKALLNEATDYNFADAFPVLIFVNEIEVFPSSLVRIDVITI